MSPESPVTDTRTTYVPAGRVTFSVTATGTYASSTRVAVTGTVLAVTMDGVNTFQYCRTTDTVRDAKDTFCKWPVKIRDTAEGHGATTCMVGLRVLVNAEALSRLRASAV
jgi:hypothetical protein